MGELLAARWLLSASLTFALLSGSRALTPPNCPVIKDTPCLGDSTNVFIKGTTTAEVLGQLCSRFCGCTYITGSLSIQLSLGTALTEDSFNSLYYLKEISGSLQFNTIPSMSTITLPNLRIIRGQDTFASSGGPVSLLVQSFTNGSLNLPSLTEVSNGRAVFVSTSGTCGFLNVRWTDILSNGLLPDYSNSECSSPSTDCSSCSSGHCWSSGSLYCQNLTKTVCPQGCGRCFKSSGDGSYQCCSDLCAAGCYGSTNTHCYACSTLNNNGSCVTQCPPALVYDPVLFKLVNNPNYRLASGGLCVQQCAANLLEYAGTCVTSCPVDYTSNNGGQCVACSGVCPRVCAGTDVNGVKVADITSGNFNNCTIVNGSLIIGEVSLGSTNLEVLSTIQEIQGYLRIEAVTTWTSFPYLRNLKKIGFPGRAVNLSITGPQCKSGGPQLYSLVLRITSLQSIDLSSLELIQYGGYVLGANPQLCYVGNFTRHLANTSSPVCLSATNSRRDPAACIANGSVCHSQCISNSSCWGPSDTQCDGCRNFVYKGRCVTQCSDVVLSPGNSGIFQNNGSGVCEDCDSQCLRGCVNGTDQYHCIRCRNYILVTLTGPLCVASCPLGTYANGTLCTPCYRGCTGGCAGPLPYVNLTNGCLKCSYVQLDQQGQQVSCLTSGCPQGTYPSTSSSPKLSSGSSQSSLQSIIQDVSTWCLPCDDVCASCTGPGNTSCTTCRYAKRLALCVSGCNNDTEYQDAALNCLTCAAGCIGCTGPSISQCLMCASESCANTDFQSSIVGIVFGGLIAMCLAIGVVIVLFIVYRRYVHKIAKINNSTFYGEGHERMELNFENIPPASSHSDPVTTAYDFAPNLKEGTPAFNCDDFSNQVTQNLLRIDVAKGSDDQFIERYCKEVKIVLQAVNKNEHVAILSKLEPPTSSDGTKMVKLQTFRKDFVGTTISGNYHLGIFGGYKAALVLTGQGGKCQQLITETYKQFPNLSLIIGAGITYAGNKHTTKVGDVLVSSLIAKLDTVKYQSNGQITGKNNETIQVRRKAKAVFCENSHEFNTFACTKGASTTRYSKVHVGTIISGPFLVNNEEIKDRLWENSVEAIGGEMEGHVLMEFMQQQNPCTFEIIIIKGVSDYGDGTKNDEWQFTAALAAVEYTHYQLMHTNGTLFPETTQTNGPALRVVGEGTAAMVQPYIELPSSGALSGQQSQLDRGQFGPPIQPSGGHPPKGSVSNTIGQQQQPMDCTDGVPYHEQLSLLNMECSEKDLLTIAGYDFRWKRVGRRLLCDQKVNDIDREESGEGDRREKMLLEWKKTKTHDATYQALVKVLRDMGNNATADRVEELRGRGN